MTTICCSLHEKSWEAKAELYQNRWRGDPPKAEDHPDVQPKPIVDLLHQDTGFTTHNIETSLQDRRLWKAIIGVLQKTPEWVSWTHSSLVTILQCTTELFLAIWPPFFFYDGTINFENLPVFYKKLPFLNFRTSKWHFKCKNLKNGLCSARLHTLVYALKKNYLNHFRVRTV